MQKQATIVGLFFSLLVSHVVEAQGSYDRSADASNVTYAYADVLRVDPVYDSVRRDDLRESCSDQQVVHEGPDDSKSSAIVEHKVDKKSGGGASETEQNCRMVRGAQHQEKNIIGFDVEYRFRGEVYISRLAYDPGDKLKVRVSIAPAQ